MFAVLCRQHGSAVVLIVPIGELGDCQFTENHFATKECEFGITIHPIELAKRVTIVVDVDDARQILLEMGFEVPIGFADRNALRGALDDTHSDGVRLSSVQIESFVAAAKVR